MEPTGELDGASREALRALQALQEGVELSGNLDGPAAREALKALRAGLAERAHGPTHGGAAGALDGGFGDGPGGRGLAGGYEGGFIKSSGFEVRHGGGGDAALRVAGLERATIGDSAGRGDGDHHDEERRRGAAGEDDDRSAAAAGPAALTEPALLPFKAEALHRTADWRAPYAHAVTGGRAQTTEVTLSRAAAATEEEEEEETQQEEGEEEAGAVDAELHAPAVAAPVDAAASAAAAARNTEAQDWLARLRGDEVVLQRQQAEAAEAEAAAAQRRQEALAAQAKEATEKELERKWAVARLSGMEVRLEGDAAALAHAQAELRGAQEELRALRRRMKETKEAEEAARQLDMERKHALARLSGMEVRLESESAALAKAQAELRAAREKVLEAQVLKEQMRAEYEASVVAAAAPAVTVAAAAKPAPAPAPAEAPRREVVKSVGPSWAPMPRKAAAWVPGAGPVTIPPPQPVTAPVTTPVTAAPLVAPAAAAAAPSASEARSADVSGAITRVGGGVDNSTAEVKRSPVKAAAVPVAPAKDPAGGTMKLGVRRSNGSGVGKPVLGGGTRKVTVARGGEGTVPVQRQLLDSMGALRDEQKRAGTLESQLGMLRLVLTGFTIMIFYLASNALGM